MAGVRIENVDKSFGPVKVIRNVDIEDLGGHAGAAAATRGQPG